MVSSPWSLGRQRVNIGRVTEAEADRLGGEGPLAVREYARVNRIETAVMTDRTARANPETMLRVHGTNERFSVDGVVESIKFFVLLIQNTDAL